jgi:glutathione gamma-glutamylcysteinyltransferase
MNRLQFHRLTSKCIKQYVRLHNSAPIESFHKRVLPSNLIALSSREGRQLFREALDEGGLECYFPLAEQFVTQSEPSFCSLSSLAMVLNALNYDPKRTWKGVWRWVSEETLQCEANKACGHAGDKVKNLGMNFAEFDAFAACHDVNIRSFRAKQSTKELNDFKSTIHANCYDNTSKSFVICNFSRKVLNQTGDGHFSPIAGYHAARDMVLILDVARFKYPPYWVSTDLLWESMAALDEASGMCRGYFIISTNNSSHTHSHHNHSTSHTHSQSDVTPVMSSNKEVL